MTRSLALERFINQIQASLNPDAGRYGQIDADRARAQIEILRRAAPTARAIILRYDPLDVGSDILDAFVSQESARARAESPADEPIVQQAAATSAEADALYLVGLIVGLMLAERMPPEPAS